ncbi:hypothetical protein CLV24_111149 [Pontibacter ummariensis]|uniref:SpoIIAA-like n=2 Tax=Pontibacter ummariensis TaxID=1610492 RepID=A0A239GNY1_9BACT|nr:hypothetical protein CLV24_111149 [Pontibacter ummariensis]SNS70575.1 hypothetical protein SAMN06296052_111149 [Pontibacter ummariensis]
MYEKEEREDLIDYKELKKADGYPFFEASRRPDNSFIAVNWIGTQSLETVVMGGNHILAMLREKPCQGLLNSNRELIGPWDAAVSWLSYKWVPQAKELGLRYYAHVLSPGIYGQRSFAMFQESLKSHFSMRPFNDEKRAEEWLQMKLV